MHSTTDAYSPGSASGQANKIIKFDDEAGNSFCIHEPIVSAENDELALIAKHNTHIKKALANQTRLLQSTDLFS